MLEVWIISGVVVQPTVPPTARAVPIPVGVRPRPVPPVHRIAPVIVSLGIAGPVAEVVELRWIYVFSGVAMLVAFLLIIFYGKLITIEYQKTLEEPVADSTDT